MANAERVGQAFLRYAIRWGGRLMGLGRAALWAPGMQPRRRKRVRCDQPNQGRDGDLVRQKV